jgi:hypothetical protein
VSSWYSFDGLLTGQLLGTSASVRLEIDNTYDPASRRLTGIAASTNPVLELPTPMFSTSYSYDPAGNVLSAAGKNYVFHVGGGTLDPDQEECFSNDYLRRLTKAWTHVSGACVTPQRTGVDPYWREWTYDKINFSPNQVVANFAVAGLGTIQPFQNVLSVFALQPAKVIIDVAGAIVNYDSDILPIPNSPGFAATQQSPLRQRPPGLAPGGAR